MGKKSRRKGVRGEQQIARKFYLHLFGEIPPADRTVFVRTKIGVRQKEGDLVVPTGFPVAVEVKNRPIPLLSVLNFSSPFRTIVLETIQRLGHSENGRDICLVIKIGTKSPFYYFVLTTSPIKWSGGEFWWRTTETENGKVWFILWFSEVEFFRRLKKKITGV